MNVTDLKAALDRASVNPERYDLSGGIPVRSEGLVLANADGQWEVRLFERGNWFTLASYGTEAEAAAALLERALHPFYRT